MNSENILLGVLERISCMVDLPWFVIEINLKGKKREEQRILIEQIEYDMASIGYDNNREFSHDHYDGIYHLHFMRGKPNA